MTAEGPQSGQTPGTPGSTAAEGWICLESPNLSEVSEPLANERAGRKPGGLGLNEGVSRKGAKRDKRDMEWTTGVGEGGDPLLPFPPLLSSGDRSHQWHRQGLCT